MLSLDKKCIIASVLASAILSKRDLPDDLTEASKVAVQVYDAVLAEFELDKSKTNENFKGAAIKNTRLVDTLNKF